MTAAPDSHVELVRTKLVAHYGSLWQAASKLSLGTMSGAQLLSTLRTLPINPGLAHHIELAIGLDPNCIPCGQAAQG